MPSAPELLSPSGPIAAALKRDGFAFEPRPQQAAMAGAVERAMAGRSRLVVEAGTGVGKSFAYLVPAIARCIQNGERVLVATNTIALQEQLISKDIPLLRGTLESWDLTPHAAPGPRSSEPDSLLHPVLVKGRGNYISLRRLKMASQRALTLFPDEVSRRDLHEIEDWAVSTLDGSLATAPAIERMAVWDRVQSDAGNCMGRKCPSYNACFYQSARREMDRGNLLITNHALFFSDLAIRARSGEEAGFLPRYDHVILDEAHNVEDVASEHFGLSLSESRIAHLLNLLYHPRTGRGFLASASLRTGDVDKVDAAHHAVLAAHDAAHEFFENLALALRNTGKPTAGRLSREQAGDIANPLTPAMKALVIRLKSMRDAIKGGADASFGEDGGDSGGAIRKSDEDRYELNSYILRATSIADEAEALIGQTLPGYVYWIEASEADADERPAGRGRRPLPRVRIACSPIEVAPILREHLFAKPHSVILTSATLATAATPARRPAAGARAAATPPGSDEATPPDPAFTHICTTIGCDAPATLRFDSPFDYARQLRLIIDLSVPDPRASRPRHNGVARRDARDAAQWPPPEDEAPTPEPADYITTLSSRILYHVRSTDGGAFVLFTSFADLFAAADLLDPHLAHLDNPIPLLVQGRRGSRSALLDEFKKNGRAVLLGAASFWQGVDVRGHALRNVVIVRLPFDPPDRPLTQARLDRVQAQGGNPFMQESLPRAIIRFKQGFGRLIRSQEDTGQVVVLDPRIVTTRYGRLFLDALPPGVAPSILDEASRREMA